MLIWNLLLALTWMALQASFTLADFVVGFVLGALIIVLTRRVTMSEPLTLRNWLTFQHPRVYVVQTWRWFAFLGFSFWSIIKSNIQVARILLSPKLNIQPGIVALPLDIKSEGGITLLANLITLTPGTVSMDVSSDRKTLYIHTLNISSVDEMRRETKQDFERRVMELLP